MTEPIRDAGRRKAPAAIRCRTKRFRAGGARHGRAAWRAVWPALALLGCIVPAWAQSVTVAVDRSQATPMAALLSGANVCSPHGPEDFADPAVRGMVRPLQPGILRWPGGTVNDFFDWSTGLIPPPGSAGHPTPIDIERAVFQPYPNIPFNAELSKATGELQPILAAKGGNPLGDAKTGFAGLATAVGAKFLVVVNTTTNTVEAAQQLALTVAQRHLPVAGFELANEPFFTVVPTSAGPIRLPAGSPKVPGAYTDGVDYLTKVKPYYDAIKQGYVAAGLKPTQAVVAVAGGFIADAADWNGHWAQDMATYTANHGAYWDAVTMHFYPSQARSGGFDQAMAYANDGLVTGTAPFIQGYRAAAWSRGKPLFVSEYDASFNDTRMNGSLYGAVFSAEYVARMSAYPETANLMLHELFNSQNGIGVPTNAIDGTGDWKAELIAAGQAGKRIDTNGHVKGLYYNAQILGVGLADAAVNASDASYATKLTGAFGSVATLTAPVPAVYAQAYHGRDGSTHLLVTNKGADSKLLSLVIDGHTVSKAVSTDWIHPSAGDPSEQNTATAQRIAILHATVTGPVTVPGYSVIHLRVPAG